MIAYDMAVTSTSVHIPAKQITHLVLYPGAFGEGEEIRFQLPRDYPLVLDISIKKVVLADDDSDGEEPDTESRVESGQSGDVSLW